MRTEPTTAAAATTTPKTRTAKFAYRKDTKNTVCYDEHPEPGQPPIIGSLYLQKWAANGAKELTVTIEMA